MSKSRVALVRCDSYEQDKTEDAVFRAVGLLGGIERILSSGDQPLSRESRLLLKPNLLAKTAPERACTTHPSVFRAAGRLLQESGYMNIRYGDSPGNPMISVEKTAEECGVKAAADSLSIPLGKFDSGTGVDYPCGRTADRFVLCDEILETDGIINVCKMKTHQLERITGAVKNMFGCVFGVNKAASHARFATAEVFARMLADLNNLLKAKLHIMDGVVAMEGNGPQSGDPRHMGLILASEDPVALDTVFCHLVDLDPSLVPTNVSGMQQGLGTCTDIEVCTDEGVLTPEEAALIYGDSSFNVQRSPEYRGMLRPVRFLAPFLEKKPFVRKQVCIGCGICVNACPVDGKAIHVRKQRNGRRLAQYEYGKCIKCYCCQEMCPENAIGVKRSLLAKLADRIWKI